MIIDLERFVAVERPFWDELERQLAALDNDPSGKRSLEDLKRLLYLHQRASADLGRVRTFAAESEISRFLDGLVARSYAEIHQGREAARRLSFRNWLGRLFPQTFRKHQMAFLMALAVTVVGSGFGAAALAIDRDAKAVLLPFAHLQGDPKERVAREEKGPNEDLGKWKTSFSASLMTHNIQVSVTVLALGITWGIGTIVMLFYNGVILGAIAFDYIHAGQTTFLLGWLLPHGVIELPAVMIAGQAGLVLAHAMIGWGSRDNMRTRFRRILPDLVTLIAGASLLLVYAGLVEAFFSQYHAPVLPYAVKISFGLVELVVLVIYLNRSGRSNRLRANAHG